MKERYLTAAIYPSGIGISGIFIKTFNSIYPRKWSTSISATNPVDAANEIIDYINGIKESLDANWYSLKTVVGELPLENLKDENENLPSINLNLNLFNKQNTKALITLVL